MPYSVVSDSVVASAGSVFAVSAPNGDIRPGGYDGLYASDTRFLSKLLLTVDGHVPTLLSSGSLEHSLAIFYNTLRDGVGPNGKTFTVVRDRKVSHGLHEDVTVVNHSTQGRTATLTLEFDADFADIFQVRSGDVQKRGTCEAEVVNESSLRLWYQRGDFIRETHITFSVKPVFDGATCVIDLSLPPKGSAAICIAIVPVTGSELRPLTCVRDLIGAPTEAGSIRAPRTIHEGEADPFPGAPTLETSHADLRLAYEQALVDIVSLRMDVDGDAILAAGLPWFMAVFGRDSALSAIQTKLLGPELMVGTLRVLARNQATEIDEFREAQPGKIPHEIRQGELSVVSEIPHSRYYGSVDATPLFLILLSEAFKWTNDMDLIRELLPAAEAALQWIDEYGDLDGDGFIEYAGAADRPLRNQCWKDSADSISFADGRLAEGPIAVCEVQGYVYKAKLGMAEIYRALNRPQRADELERQAKRLRNQFEQAFWMSESGYYALALDGQKRQVDSITSNPGHCLWSGIVDPARARKVAERLRSNDMFNGWGIRTLSSEMSRYDPMSYHNGSVWPHDNSIIAAGLANYGLLAEADDAVGSLLGALAKLPGHRLPELFAGYPRRTGSIPVSYPAANSPQAWATGVVIYSLEILLHLNTSGETLSSDSPLMSRPLSMRGVTFRGRKWDI